MEFVDACPSYPEKIKRKRKNGQALKISYINLPCAFDIETSSFEDQNGEKTGIMYLWQFGINGNVIIGRTWDDFIYLCQVIHDRVGLSPDKRLVVYIHNLSFEFQWIQHRFKWYDLFALDVREPIYAVTDTGIEFRCSYKLSGYSLEKLSKQLTTYKIQKLVGSLDYDKIRHAETPLTHEEQKYGIYDVLVVMAYIREKMDVDGDITKLQLTKTGYVRKYCRDMCLYKRDEKNPHKFKEYRRLIESLTITPDEYLQMKRAFAGGFTHASARYVDKVVENVDSFDFTSSYPYVMVSEKFPMSAGQLLRPDQWHGKLDYYLQHYCCIFDVEFTNITPRLWYDNPISSSKCYLIGGKRLINNGRVVFADKIRLTVTDVDFAVIKQFYQWDHMGILNFRIYRRGYLPKYFILAILELYKNKTTLKGVEERQTDYMISKENLNSCYGMTVTDIVRDIITYTETWEKTPPDLNDVIEKYNTSKARFLFYAWGLFVTSYARRNLFTGIKAFGDDYLYADTDSVKAVNAARHQDYIDRYNANVRVKLERVSEFYKIPFEMFEPETIKGKKKLLGVWECETTDHKYEKFKTLGAKRYMIKGKNVLYDETKKIYYDLSITVSGVNKFKAVPYLIEKYGIDGAFDEFRSDDDGGLLIPAEYTGKLIHTYIDYPQDGIVTDYTGRTIEYHELSSVHLSNSEYSMSKSKEFANFLKGYREKQI